ncbi:MAG: hypothetical protein H6559_33350 [Lewinellaceae bacterium]|nr:hypothetical protein [Lewinellaceae bacterium]
MNNINSGNTQWLTFLLAAAALHGLWLAGLLFAKNEGKQGLKLLTAAFVLVSLYLLNYLFSSPGLFVPLRICWVFLSVVFLIVPVFTFCPTFPGAGFSLQVITCGTSCCRLPPF